MDKITVLFITIELSLKTQSGAGIYAAGLVESLSNHGVKVIVVAPGMKNKREVVNKNLIIYWVKIIDKPLLRIPSFYFKIYNRVQNIIKKEKIDIIHNNEYAGLTILGRKPSITTIHHPAYKDFKNFSLVNKILNISDQIIEKIILKKTDLIVSDSHLTYNLLKKSYPKFNNKLKIVNVGVDTNRFSFNKKNKIRKFYNIPSDSLIFFQPGGARSKRKGSIYLFKALGKLRNKYKFKCIVSGESREFSWRKAFNNSIISNNIQDNIILSNEIPYNSLQDYYSVADIVLFPSTFEGFGIPVLEALSCERPLIATKTGEAKYIITNRENALLINPQNSEDIYKAISEILSTKNLRMTLINNSRKSVVKKYDWNIIAHEVTELYRDLLKYDYNNK